MRKDRDTGRTRDVNRIPRGNVERARNNAAGAPSSPPLPGKVVAELMFGFWTYLFVDAHEKAIWVPHLHKAFPAGSESERRRIVYVIRLLSSDVLAHVKASSEVSAILADRP